jgi:hypothetical protein
MAPPRKPETYELESLLYDIDHEGFVVIHRDKLLRLLGKGNESAGTWIALQEAWEGIDGASNELRLARIPGNKFILMKQVLIKVQDWK